MNSQSQLMLHQAIEAFQATNFDRAESILKKVIQLDSKCLPAFHILGLIKASQSKHNEAAELLKKAAKLNPDDASIHYNLAQALAHCEANKEALPHHKKAVELNPTNAAAWLGYGKTQSSLGLHEEALAKYDRAIGLNPSYTEAYLNKGATLKELKRYEEAITFADKTLNLDPSLAEAWSNKGIALKGLKHYEEAIRQFDQAITLKPTYAEAWSNKGNALHELKRYEEALIYYDKAIELKPSYAEAYSNKGSSLHELKRYEEAISYFNKAITSKLNIDWVHGELLNMEMMICEWSGFREKRAQLIKKVKANEKVSFPFPLLSLCDDASLHKQGATLYSQSEFPQKFSLGDIAKRNNPSKIKIAYFSADFKEHPVSYLTTELFQLHDRSQFEVSAFSLKAASDNDQMHLNLRNVFDHFYDVENFSDEEIAKYARTLEIDIAVDLSGHTKDSRTGIFSYRAAPIQVNYLGYPGTLGADYFDYIIADETIIPEAFQQFYSEKIAYLPHSYMVDDRNRIPSARIFTRAECDIPDNAFVYCCFNNGNKFNEQVLQSWTRILSEVQSSVLWVSENNETFKTNLLKEFKNLGIDASRIIFAKRVADMRDHLARYKLADLFLDTFPYNAHTTSMDSLKAGVPVLTLISKSFAGRVAASLLNAIGLPSLITTSQDEYESLAIQLGKNPDQLMVIKKQLAENHSTMPLFDTPLFTKHIESAYSMMMNRYWSNLPPEHLNVSPQEL